MPRGLLLPSRSLTYLLFSSLLPSSQRLFLSPHPQLVGAGIYLLASVAMSMLIVHFFQVLGVSHLLMVNTKRCIRRCKSDAGDDGPVVEMSTAGMRGGKRTKSTVMHTNPNGPPRRHPKEQIRAGETVLV